MLMACCACIIYQALSENIRCTDNGQRREYIDMDNVACRASTDKQALRRPECLLVPDGATAAGLKVNIHGLLMVEEFMNPFSHLAICASGVYS